MDTPDVRINRATKIKSYKELMELKTTIENFFGTYLIIKGESKYVHKKLDPLNPALKGIQYIELHCEKSGQLVVNEDKKKKIRSKKVNCPMKLCFKRSLCGQYLTLDPSKPFEESLIHKNHKLWRGRSGKEIVLPTEEAEGSSIDLESLNIIFLPPSSTPKVNNLMIENTIKKSKSEVEINNHSFVTAYKAPEASIINMQLPISNLSAEDFNTELNQSNNVVKSPEGIEKHEEDLLETNPMEESVIECSPPKPPSETRRYVQSLLESGARPKIVIKKKNPKGRPRILDNGLTAAGTPKEKLKTYSEASSSQKVQTLLINFLPEEVAKNVLTGEFKLNREYLKENVTIYTISDMFKDQLARKDIHLLHKSFTSGGFVYFKQTIKKLNFDIFTCWQCKKSIGIKEGLLVSCDLCLTWAHTTCVNYQEDSDSQDQMYYCSTCEELIKKKYFLNY